MELSLDEIIIDFVRENHCLYDKRDVDFKNINKKKELWKKISEMLKNLYNVDMSAEGVEKRWSSLRDMFSRENRRQKLPPSGSGYEPTKEWELYRNMLFLIPHIAHRRTKSSFIQQTQSQSLILETSTTNTTPFKKFKQSSNLIVSQPSYDHSYSESIQSIDEEDEPSLNIGNEEITISTDGEILTRPASTASTFSNYSSTSNITSFSESSTNSNPVNFKNPLKPLKKITPEMDEFAKRRKSKHDQIDLDLTDASKEISAAMKTVSSLISNETSKDGYMLAIEEGLKYIPCRNKTQCLIEVLQIIQKYEERK